MNNGKTDKNMTVWSGQSDLVWDTLQKNGNYVVKRKYVEQKYKDTAWIFQEAYSYMAAYAEKMVPKPEGAESPIWVYPNVCYIHGGEDMHYLKINIPSGYMILFDRRKWNKILNLSYIGEDEYDERKFEKWLQDRGIEDSLKIFSTPYYAIEKEKVKKSWSRIFEHEDIEEKYLQGMIWEIRKEWISEIK